MGSGAVLRYLAAIGELEKKIRLLEGEVRALRGIRPEDEARCGKEPNDRWLAHVKIVGSTDDSAEVYIDGKKVRGVVSYRVEQIAGEQPEPLLTLRVRCDLDLDCPAIPLLPEPWTWAYQPRSDYFSGRYFFEAAEPGSGIKEPTG